MTEPIITPDAAPSDETELPPLLHAYREEHVATDNRGIEVFERKTVYGLEPTGFIRYLARCVVPLPVPDPRHPTGWTQQHRRVQAAVTAETPLEAIERAEGALRPVVQQLFDDHRAQIQGAASRIITARGMPPARR